MWRGDGGRGVVRAAQGVGWGGRTEGGTYNTDPSEDSHGFKRFIKISGIGALRFRSLCSG